jgi:hypothetical protein
MVRPILGVMAAVLLLPAGAEAHFFRSLFGPRTVTSYYYPAPVVYYPPTVVAYPCPVPVVPAVAAPVIPVRPLATPVPAPPSRTPEPPSASPLGSPAPVPAPAPPPGQPVPQTGEARFYDAYAAGGRDAARASGRTSVAFWNLSDRDLVLLAGGQRLLLPRGRSATLELDRQFTWQVEGRPAIAEQVPANESAWEIMIRR